MPVATGLLSEVQLIAMPRGGAAWPRRMLDDLPAPSLAHAPEWLTIVRQTYGHEPLYLTGEDEQGRPGVLPAFIVRRPLLGAVVTSMPYLDSGGPCTSSPVLSASLVDRLLQEAQRAGASAVDVRCAAPLPIAYPAAGDKVNLTLTLPPDPDRLMTQLDGSVRSQIRKAAKSGLEIEHGASDAAAIDAFYDAFAVRMRDLGSPVHARRFFHAVIGAFGRRARLLIVRKGTTVVGGLMALAVRDRLVVPWAACLKEYFALCPNMLLYWEALRAACRDGFRTFDFGRSSRGCGTYRFKRQWGAVDEPLLWYRIPVTRFASRREADGRSRASLAVAAWQRLPLPVASLLGPRIRKYLIQ